MESKTFCVLPFMHLATNPSGNLRVCCNSTPSENFILKDNNTPYKIYKDDLHKAWNSDTYKTIRTQMLNGDRPDMCIRCFREEDSGISSARQAWNQKWQEDKIYTVDTPFEIKYIDLRLGNLCNLRCRMCNPYSSNQWLKEWHLISDELPKEEHMRLKRMDWPNDEKMWENLIPLLDNVEEIYLTGGEPTIIKEQHKILDYLIYKNIAYRIKLKYNTNLTNIPKNLVSKWAKFKRVQLNCSVDATDKLNRYIRYPSDWNTIVTNLNILSSVTNVDIQLHCTVQMYNILRLDKFIDWAMLYNFKIYFNMLNHPNWLNIRVLPQPLKVCVEKMLKDYYHLPKVKGIVDYMNAEDWSHFLSNFYKYTKNLDNSRTESLATLIPELYEI